MLKYCIFFPKLTMNVSKHLEYFLYIGKDNSMKKIKLTIMQVHIYIQSVGLAKMAIKRLQGNNREKYNYMYVSRYTCTIILEPHSSSVDKQCFIYIHFFHHLNHTLLSLPIASPSPGTITSPVLLNVRFLPGQHCGLNNVSR